jgi:hypothetical protein
MMSIAMTENVPINESPESFIGSMKGTVEIVGDIVVPIGVKWGLDTEASGDPLEGPTDR